MYSETWMDEARQIAAQCWCDDETKDRVMDPALAESVAMRISVWMDTAAQFSRNEDFYRGLVDQCAENLGPLREKAFVQDDGGVVDCPLRMKVPGLVAELATMVAGQSDNVASRLPRTADGVPFFVGDTVYMPNDDPEYFGSEEILELKVTSICQPVSFVEYRGDFNVIAGDAEGGNLDFYSSREACRQKHVSNRD